MTKGFLAGLALFGAIGCASVGGRPIADIRNEAMLGARSLDECSTIDGEFELRGKSVDAVSGKQEEVSFGRYVLGRSGYDQGARSFSIRKSNRDTIVISITEFAELPWAPASFEWKASCVNGVIRMFTDQSGTTDGTPFGEWDIYDWLLDAQGNLVLKHQYASESWFLFWKTSSDSGSATLTFSRVRP
jgi:hypothetical protein